MYHRNYTTYLHKELDFLKLLVSRFHEQEKVNGLELDVALQKTQEVYEQLLRVKLMPEDEPFENISIEKPAKQPEPPKNEPPVLQSVDVIAQERVVVVKEEKKQQVDSAKSGILADKLGASDFQPINETLAQQKTENNLSSKLQTAPLNSISSGIGLNDKFLYIRELFGSDNVLYNNAIKHLDSADSLKDALNYIHQNFDWDEKNETARKLIHLVHRRHGNK